MVEDDLATSRLVQIEVEGLTLEMPSFQLSSALPSRHAAGPRGAVAA
jgi:hypothetical protein